MYFRVLALAATALLFVFVSNAQTPAPTRIAVINSYHFSDEKAGITKYVSAAKALNAEFTPTQNEINTMNTRLQALSKEIEGLRSVSAANPASVQAKYDEAEKLQRDIKFKGEDARARYSKREQQVLGPIQESIGKALQEFAKQKGYALIFDAAKDQNGLLVAIGDQSLDVSKDFIVYYNARP